MPELNPLSNEQIFLKKIAENTGSNYNTGDISEINPLTIDQILLKEIAANTAGQSGDITALEEKVSDTQDMISDAYDSTHTYNVGDYCIYEDVLYKCNTASTTGTWDSSKWDAVSVAEELGELTERMIEKIPIQITTDSDGICELTSMPTNGKEVVTVVGDQGNRPLMFYVNYNSDRTEMNIRVRAWYSDFITPAASTTFWGAVFVTKV